MLEQLDLFGTGVVKKDAQNPLEKRAERKLVPPTTVIEEEPVAQTPPISIAEPEVEIVQPPALEVEETLIAPRKTEPKKEKDKPGKRGRKSLKEMTEEAELVNVPDDEILFRKQFCSQRKVVCNFPAGTYFLPVQILF